MYDVAHYFMFIDVLIASSRTRSLLFLQSKSSATHPTGQLFISMILHTLIHVVASQIMVGGSNFGELLGALSVVFFTNAVPTPIPWLRLDALFLQIVWILPYISVERGSAKSAWRIAGCFIPISFGWAAGDVSLAAFIQGTLARMESSDNDVSALGAVMAFVSHKFARECISV
jgi:hypothetical protein